MHQALYRKWRPATFEDVCGQDHITSVLKYEVQNAQLSHAYLFCGSRGTGKTTCAKILAKAANCESPINGNPCGKCEACRAIESETVTDIIEMDAASNNGVEDIRSIRDEVMYTPTMLKYRVYIVDEVHMLSASAFNALLKTLEEPPSHVIFILATTELQKLPATIISRCQRFEFRRISAEILANRISYIAEQENIKMTPDAAHRIARYAQGGMRDAISLMELCSGGNKSITVESVDDSVGSVGRSATVGIANAIIGKNYEAVFAAIDEAVRSSRDISVFWQDLIGLYRDMLIVKTVKDPASYLDLTDIETKQLREIAQLFPKETLLSHIKFLNDGFVTMQKSGNMKRLVAEMTLIRMCDESLTPSYDALLSRVGKLEDSIASIKRNGIAVKPTAPSESEPAAEVHGSAEPAPKEISVSVVGEEQMKSEGGKRVLKQLRGWSEILERAIQADSMTGAFFAQAAAYVTEDNKIILRFDSDMMPKMIKQYDAMTGFCNILSSQLDRSVGRDDVTIEVVPKSDEESTLDEIILAADE